MALQAVSWFHIGGILISILMLISPKTGRKKWKKRIQFHDFCQVSLLCDFHLGVKSSAYYRMGEWVFRGERQGRDTEKREEPVWRGGWDSLQSPWNLGCTLVPCVNDARQSGGGGTNLVTQGTTILLHVSCSRNRTWKVKVIRQIPRPLPPALRIPQNGKGVRTPLHRKQLFLISPFWILDNLTPSKLTVNYKIFLRSKQCHWKFQAVEVGI